MNPWSWRKQACTTVHSTQILVTFPGFTLLYPAIPSSPLSGRVTAIYNRRKLNDRVSMSGLRRKSCSNLLLLHYLYHCIIFMPPRWCFGKESACQCRRCRFNPWVRRKPWRREWQPTPVFLPGESHGERSLAGATVHGGRKGSDTAEQLSTHT